MTTLESMNHNNNVNPIIFQFYINWPDFCCWFDNLNMLIRLRVHKAILKDYWHNLPISTCDTSNINYTKIIMYTQQLICILLLLSK